MGARKYGGVEHRIPGFRGMQGVDDNDILQWVNTECWTRWEQPYRAYWKQVEENVRMLSGRQYDTYIEALGEFVDLSTWFASNDERWRKYPVFNWVAHYYKLTLSKLTENVPVVGFVPATPDEADARLAMVMEPVFKSAWRRMNLPELMFDLYGWVITGSRGILGINWNPDLGPVQEWTGPAIIHLLGPDGGIETRVISDAPYLQGPNGMPMPALQNVVPDPDTGSPLLHPHTGMPIAHPGADNGPVFGKGTRQRLGDLEASVISPVSVIMPHGPQPHFRKPWYCHEFLMHVDEIQEKYNLDQVPDVHFKGKDQIIFKVEYGTNYGMPSLNYGGTGGLGTVYSVATEDYAVCRALWCPDNPEDELFSKGRLTVVTHDQILYDDVNPYWVDGTQESAVIPFHFFDLIKFPFRQEGHGDLEIINPINRAYNRRKGGLMDAVDFAEQPIRLRDRNAGWDEDADDLNQPGGVKDVTRRPGMIPLEYVVPPPLPEAGVQMAKDLEQLMQLFGSQPFGSEGLPVTTDASGELQREVRFDTDRVWGATMRKHSYEWARVALTIQKVYASCMTDDRLLTLAGEDNGYDFIAVKPAMFQGEVHCVPQPESSVLESRQDKQNRIMNLVQNQVLPPPMALEALGYPDLTRLMRPGGAAYAMAERENLEMVLGVQPPVLLEHNHQVHIERHTARQQTIEYRNAGPEIQQRFQIHVALHKQAMAQQQLQDMQAMAPVVAGHAAMAKTATDVAAPGGAPGAPQAGPTPAAPRLALAR